MDLAHTHDRRLISKLKEHPLSGFVPNMRSDEWHALLDDVAERGVITPLEILRDGTILDGRHRYRAARELGLARIPVHIVHLNGIPAEEYMIKAALLRRNLTDDQRAVLALEWQRCHTKGRGYRTDLVKNGSEPVDTVSTGSEKSRTKSTRLFAVPERKVRGVAQIKKLAPKLYEAVGAGTMTLHDARRQTKEREREKKRKKNQELIASTQPVEAIGQKFPTIVIDPPWDWSDEGDQDQLGRARPTYATMTFNEIAALPIGELSDENAHIYLWITNRSLPKGFELLMAWGFRYITCLTWCKPSYGMGNYFRGSTEHVIFGVKGSLELLRRDVGTWFSVERPGDHSEKPDEFYGLVESCSPGPWLDMFARKPRQGWRTWGAEVDGQHT